MAYYDGCYEKDFFGLMSSVLSAVAQKKTDLTGECYVEVNDRRYILHPDENNIIRERKPPKFLRTRQQDVNETQIRRKKKVS